MELTADYCGHGSRCTIRARVLKRKQETVILTKAREDKP